MDHVCFSREDILNELDRRAELGEFPMLDNGHVYLADTRLSAYGDDSRWAIVIEVLGVNNTIGTHYSIHNALYCFGNCLIHSLVTKPENVLHPTADSSEDPTFQADYEIYVRPEARTLRIRGHAVPITTDPSVLEARGIILVEPPAVTVIDLLRSLLPAYRGCINKDLRFGRNCYVWMNSFA